MLGRGLVRGQYGRGAGGGKVNAGFYLFSGCTVHSLTHSHSHTTQPYRLAGTVHKRLFHVGQDWNCLGPAYQLVPSENLEQSQAGYFVIVFAPRTGWALVPRLTPHCFWRASANCTPPCTLLCLDLEHGAKKRRAYIMPPESCDSQKHIFLKKKKKEDVYRAYSHVSLWGIYNTERNAFVWASLRGPSS